MEIEEEERGADFYVLPEGCIAYSLSLTSPRDACRSSWVSSVFKRAAESDIVWEKFLPPDYQEILSRSAVPPSSFVFSSKKELYFFLCNHPILIDGGTKSFALDKCTGKKVYVLGARGLSITWGSTPEYWGWKPLPECRFPEVAELLAVCWLEIRGKMETRMLSPKTTYGVYFVMKFGEDVYGLHHTPAEVSVNFVGRSGEKKWFSSGSLAYMDTDDNLDQEDEAEGQFPRDRGDGWMEIEMGEFFNDEAEDGELQMTLTEIKGGHWKGGLIVQGIELRPK